MRTVGIIGGLGPETTAHFCLEIIKQYEEAGASSRPPILMWNVPLQLEIERDLILRSKGEERYVPLLIEAAQRLERGGADFLVMPCNSLHIFIRQIRDSVSIPVLSIVDTACEHLKKRHLSKVGILATATTVRSGMFQRAFNAAGIEPVLPAAPDQDLLARIILKIIEGKSGPTERKELEEIIRRMEINTILLACTDLQLLFQGKEEIQVIDTMQVLAGAVVNEL
ncbi:amino acid racemase [Patescibacteria group bacterium]|nr:amino acid racemase [Patescibacteria group bacterium]